jgi:hypothetical protein
MTESQGSSRDYEFTNVDDLVQAIRAADVLDQDYTASRETTWEEPYPVLGGAPVEGTWRTRWKFRITSTHPRQTEA